MVVFVGLKKIFIWCNVSQLFKQIGAKQLYHGFTGKAETEAGVAKSEKIKTRATQNSTNPKPGYPKTQATRKPELAKNSTNRKKLESLKPGYPGNPKCPQTFRKLRFLLNLSIFSGFLQIFEYPDFQVGNPSIRVTRVSGTCFARVPGS